MLLQEEILLERLASRAARRGNLPPPAWAGTVDQAINSMRGDAVKPQPRPIWQESGLNVGNRGGCRLERGVAGP